MIKQYPFYEQLNSLVQNSYTLQELGFNVKIGDIIWNQHKEKLSDSGNLLIYSSNIVNNQLVFGNGALSKKEILTVLPILIN